MMRNKYKYCFFALCFFIITSSCSNADAQIREDQKENAYEIRSSVSYIPLSGGKSIPGDIGIVTSVNEVSRNFRLFEKLPLKFSLGTQYTDIRNTTAFELPSNLTGVSLGLEATAPFFNFDNTYLRLGVSPSFYAQDWFIRTSSFRLPFRGVFIYKPDCQLIWIFGVAVYPGYENKVLPVLGFIYKPNDKLSFHVTPKHPNISYALNDSMSVFAEAGGSVNSEFEVTRGAAKNTVLSYKESRVGAGIKYEFNKYIQGVFSSGGVFSRSLKYLDTSDKLSIKNGMYFEWRIMVNI